MATDTTSDQRQSVIRVAEELFAQRPSWVTFFREVLGIDGIARQTFTTPDALAEFERSADYLKIQHMLVKLREDEVADHFLSREPTRIITVRLPKSMHELLKAEAHQLHTSMNKLCIAKLGLAPPVDPDASPPSPSAAEAAN